MADDVVFRLAGFENLAERDQKFCISRCPPYVRRSLDLLRGLPPDRKSLDTAAAFALQEGLPLLERFPGLVAVRQARESVLKSGDDRIVFFEGWGYQLCGHHEGPSTLWCRILPDLAAEYARLGSDLGLPASTVAVLGIIAVLLQVDDLPDHLKQQMVTELITFGTKLRKRATDAVEIACRVLPASVSRSFTFEDVLAKVEREPM
jgi:hypothetical protein